MASDSPEGPPTSEQAESRQRSLANLRPPIKPGETRNKTGYNGRDKSRVIVEFLEAVDPKAKTDKARIVELLESAYLRARLGNGVALKTLLEQYFGKPRQALEVFSPDGSMSPQQIRDKETTGEMRARLQAILDATGPREEQQKAIDGTAGSAEEHPSAE